MNNIQIRFLDRIELCYNKSSGLISDQITPGCSDYFFVCIPKPFFAIAMTPYNRIFIGKLVNFTQSCNESVPTPLLASVRPVMDVLHYSKDDASFHLCWDPGNDASLLTTALTDKLCISEESSQCSMFDKTLAGGTCSEIFDVLSKELYDADPDYLLLVNHFFNSLSNTQIIVLVRSWLSICINDACLDHEFKAKYKPDRLCCQLINDMPFCELPSSQPWCEEPWFVWNNYINKLIAQYMRYAQELGNGFPVDQMIMLNILIAMDKSPRAFQIQKAYSVLMLYLLKAMYPNISMTLRNAIDSYISTVDSTVFHD